MDKLKVGIVGCNGITLYSHIPAWVQLKDEVEIVAVSDRIEERMNIENIEGISKNIKKYKDYHDMIADKDIDIIDIATPNYLHSIISVEALEAGKNVLTEKPDAISVSEMQRMIAAEKKSGKLLMACRNCRHYPVAEFFKKYIDDGKLGEIYSGSCGYIRRRGIPGKGGWFTTKALSGGGPVFDLGVHMLDLAIYYMGNPKAVSITGCTFNKFSETDLSDSVNSAFGDKVPGGIFDVEDSAMGFIRFENGSCLQLEFSWASNIEQEKDWVELRGTKGGIYFTSKDLAKNAIFTEENGTLVNIYPKCPHYGGHPAVMKNFVDVLMGRDKPDYTTEQGLQMIKILEGFYKSAELGREIEI